MFSRRDRPGKVITRNSAEPLTSASGGLPYKYHLRSISDRMGLWPRNCHRFLVASPFNVPLQGAGLSEVLFTPLRKLLGTRHSILGTRPYSTTNAFSRLPNSSSSTPIAATVAIVAHHPQAVYFGMKSGFVPSEVSPDELIAGTERGGRAVVELGDVAVA